MNLGDFSLEQAVLELRYPPAFLFFDHPGALWSKATAKYKDLRFQQVESGKIVFRKGDSWDVSSELVRTVLVEHHPERSLEQFMGFTRDFTRLVEVHMQLAAYDRVGFRTIYRKTVPNEAAASEAILSTSLLHLPAKKIFNIDPPAIQSEIAFRYQSKAVGVTIRLKADERKFEISPPPGMAMKDLEHVATIKSTKYESWGVVLDIDYYTILPIDAAQLDVGEWIKQAHHAIRRDVPEFLGE